MKIYVISFTAAGLALEKQITQALKGNTNPVEDSCEESACRESVSEKTAFQKAFQNTLKNASHERSASRENAWEIVTATRYRGTQEGEEIRFAKEGMEEWTRSAMEHADAVLYIGACGIAVRAIAPFVRDKLKDPAVLVMDERGQFVIPLLSGHVGGANQFASTLGDLTGALPVITTATDINGAFSADLFAREHSLQIRNRKAIAPVSTKAIEGKPVRLCIDGFPPSGMQGEEQMFSPAAPDVFVTDPAQENGRPLFFSASTLVLCPKKYAVGMGCKKGTSFEELERAFSDALTAERIDQGEVGALCSIDLKSDEPGLLELSARHRLPFLTFSAEVLGKIKGDFSGSGFVHSQVGVDNVCERSAMAAVGMGGVLVLPKKVYPGITIAVAQTGASSQSVSEGMQSL